jgi:hypothetical protein
MREWQGWLLALAFGIGWNLLLGWRLRHGQRGLLAFWVIGGVLGTLLISALVTQSLGRLVVRWNGELLSLTNQQHAALYELRFFICSGLPLAFGSLRRNWTLLVHKKGAARR